MSNFIETWQGMMVESYPWVLFENGTCVMLVQPSEDPEQHAIRLLKELVANFRDDLSDIGVQELDRNRGWIVSSGHPDIYTLITSDEVPEDYQCDTLSIGSHARKKRKLDAEVCKVIHMEAERPHKS